MGNAKRRVRPVSDWRAREGPGVDGSTKKALVQDETRGMGSTKKQVRPVSELEGARRALGLTQLDVAKRAGISPQYVGLLEGGLRPTARVAGAIAAVLQRNPEELFSDD